MKTRWVLLGILLCGCIESNPQPSPGGSTDVTMEGDTSGATDTAADAAADAADAIGTEIGTDTSEPDTPCVPVCTNDDGVPFECGDDGCGGQCGECINDCNIDWETGCVGEPIPDASLCDLESGTCADICCPSCCMKECGPDGCGGICGSCGEGFVCEGNICVEVGTEYVIFQAAVEGFGMAGQLIADVTVEIIDNATGKGTDVTAVSNADGYVVFGDLEKGKLYGFKCSMDNYKDTFVWNIPAQDTETDTIWIVPNSVYQMALGLAGLTQEDGKGVVVGAVYWTTWSGDEAIGCATVTSDPETPDIRYMSSDNGLPTILEHQACTAPMDTEGNGRFIVANIPAGQISLTAWDSEGGEIGVTQMWAIGDSIAVSNIYAATGNYETNPTPGVCGCQP